MSSLQWLSLASWPWAEQLGLAAGPSVLPLSSTISYLTSSPMMAHLLLPAQTFCSLHSPLCRSFLFFFFFPFTSTLIGAPVPSPSWRTTAVSSLTTLFAVLSSKAHPPHSSQREIVPFSSLETIDCIPYRLKISLSFVSCPRNITSTPSLYSCPAMLSIFLFLSTRFAPVLASGPLHLLLPQPRVLFLLSPHVAVCCFGIF